MRYRPAWTSSNVLSDRLAWTSSYNSEPLVRKIGKIEARIVVCYLKIARIVMHITKKKDMLAGVVADEEESLNLIEY